MKKRLCKCGIWLCLFALCGLSVIKCDAKEGNGGDGTPMTLMVTQNKTEVFENRDDAGEVITTLEEETAVLCFEEDDDGWIKILYQDYEGYVKAENLAGYGNQGELEEEFGNLSVYYENGFEKIREMQRKRTQTLIWATVISLLLVASAIVAIISAIRNKGNQEED